MVHHTQTEHFLFFIYFLFVSQFTNNPIGFNQQMTWFIIKEVHRGQHLLPITEVIPQAIFVVEAELAREHFRSLRRHSRSSEPLLLV